MTNQASLSSVLEDYRPGLLGIIKPNGKVQRYDDRALMIMRLVELADQSERPRRLRMRSKTSIEVHGTMYGREHTVRTSVKHHSPSGINKDYLLADRGINVCAIQKMFRNSVTDEQASLTTLNRITTSFINSENVEN